MNDFHSQQWKKSKRLSCCVKSSVWPALVFVCVLSMCNHSHRCRGHFGERKNRKNLKLKETQWWLTFNELTWEKHWNEINVKNYSQHFICDFSLMFLSNNTVTQLWLRRGNLCIWKESKNQTQVNIHIGNYILHVCETDCFPADSLFSWRPVCSIFGSHCFETVWLKWNKWTQPLFSQ